MKRSVFTMTIATLLVAAMAMTAEAQRQGGRGGQQGGRGGQQGGRGGPGGMMGGGMMGRGGGGLLQLAQMEAVQKEILAEDKKEEIDKLAESLRGERPDMSGFREMSEEDRTKFFEKMQKERAERSKKGDAALAEILIPPQMERLEELRVQQMGIRALADEKVAAKLELGSKKAKIEAAMQKMGEEMMTIFRSGDRENMREKVDALRKKADTDVLGLLSADQKKKFEALKGEAFEMPQRQFGRGGPGGGRGGEGGGERSGRPQRPGV